MSFYNAFTHGMTPLPTAPHPLWTFDARSAGQRAWSRTARAGGDGDACEAAYREAYDRVVAQAA